MRILILHRVPDSFVRYAANIDHSRHEVTYVSAPDRVVTLPPADVPGSRITRPGAGDTATEVLEVIAGLPAPEVVVALSEYDLLAAGRLRDVLGVPGPSEREVLPTRDKVVMKSVVTAAGLRAPRFLPLPEALRDGSSAVPWTGRTVLKPLAGASSEGVSTFDTPAQAIDGALTHPAPADDLEIEEFVEGPILHVDGLMTAGAPVAVQASAYVGTCLDFAQGAPLGSVQIDTDPAVLEWTLRCLKALDIENGPFHLEGVSTPDGMVFLEVGARFGGADVVDTFELATGVRLPSAHVRLLVDGAGDPPVARVPGPGERYGWFVFPGHVLGTRHCRISGHERFPDHPQVLRWVQRTPEELISPSVIYADHLVPIAGLVGPGTTGQLEGLLTEMFASVRVEPHGPAVS